MKVIKKLLIQSFLSIADYKGTINRKDFWITYFSLSIMYSFFAILAIFISDISSSIYLVFIPFALIYCAIVLALAVRRLNDTNASPLWIAIYFTILFILEVLDSKGRLEIEHPYYFIGLVFILFGSMIWILFKLCSSSYIHKYKKIQK